MQDPITATEEMSGKIAHMLRDAVTHGMSVRDAADTLMANLIPMIHATDGTLDDALAYVQYRTRELWEATDMLMREGLGRD
jgi:hypothetical protein